MADDLFYAQFAHRLRPTEAVSLILDLRSGHALSVVSVLGQPAAEPDRRAARLRAVAHRGGRGSPGTRPHRQRADRPAGRSGSTRASTRTSTSTSRRTGTRGTASPVPSRGLADTDENTVWRSAPGSTCSRGARRSSRAASVTIADHRDQSALRSHGVLFGSDESGRGPTHFTFGAHGRLLSTTRSSRRVRPARRWSAEHYGGADLILTGGAVRTANRAQPLAAALAISAGRDPRRRPGADVLSAFRDDAHDHARSGRRHGVPGLRRRAQPPRGRRGAPTCSSSRSVPRSGLDEILDARAGSGPKPCRQTPGSPAARGRAR